MSLKEVLAARHGGPAQAALHCASGLSDQEHNPLDSARRDGDGSAKNAKILRRADNEPSNSQVHNLDLINCGTMPLQDQSAAGLESRPHHDNQEEGK